MSNLRLDRRGASRWTLSDGTHIVGWLAPGAIHFTHFPDEQSAADAAATAANVLRDWVATHSHIPRGNDQASRIIITPDGFECQVPDTTWMALVTELAQRIHTATRSLRTPTEEPAA